MIGALPFSSAVRKLFFLKKKKQKEGIGQQKRWDKNRKYNGPIIISILCDISYPGKRLVPTFLHNLQVAHLNAWYRKVRNFEFDSDRGAFLKILFYDIERASKIDWKRRGQGGVSTAFNTGQAKVCTHEEFATAA